MHVIYTVYVLICVSQTALFLLIISQGIHFVGVDLNDAGPPIPFPFKIVSQPNNLNLSNNEIYRYYLRTVLNDNNNSKQHKLDYTVYPTIVLISENIYLDKEACICSILAVLFSVLYIYLHKLDQQSSFLETNADNEYFYDAVNEHRLKALEMVRFIFWIFVFMQYLIVFSSTSLPIKTEERNLYVLLKVMIVWFLCKTGKEKKTGIVFLTMIAAYLYMLWIFAISLSRRDISYKKSLILFTLETILDAVLILGHHWDKQAPIITVLNCRLFYTAGASTLSLLVPVIIQ
jgi:hypothetical protein